MKVSEMRPSFVTRTHLDDHLDRCAYWSCVFLRQNLQHPGVVIYTFTYAVKTRFRFPTKSFARLLEVLQFHARDAVADRRPRKRLRLSVGLENVPKSFSKC